IISLNHTDDPDTLQYSCRTLVPDTLLRVEINIGFRIQPRVTVYLRQIVEDLVAAGEIDLCSRYGSLRSRGIPGNFRFILIHRIFSPSSNCSVRAAAMMQMYGWLRRLGISDESAMGLDTSNVTVETVPLIINHQEPRRIGRVK
ncbi:MAG: potassium transporter Kup, partial [Duncaniella sp.]|nr:potassium transporter Kup [Duncaniella sp.]